MRQIKEIHIQSTALILYSEISQCVLPGSPKRTNKGAPVGAEAKLGGGGLPVCFGTQSFSSYEYESHVGSVKLRTA